MFSVLATVLCCLYILLRLMAVSRWNSCIWHHYYCAPWVTMNNSRMLIFLILHKYYCYQRNKVILLLSCLPYFTARLLLEFIYDAIMPSVSLKVRRQCCFSCFMTWRFYFVSVDCCPALVSVCLVSDFILWASSIRVTVPCFYFRAVAGWGVTGYVFTNISLLAIGTWAVADRQSVDALFMVKIHYLLVLLMFLNRCSSWVKVHNDNGQDHQ